MPAESLLLSLAIRSGKSSHRNHSNNPNHSKFKVGVLMERQDSPQYQSNANHRHRVLVIEDETDQAQGLIYALKEQGWEVTHAEDGNRGLVLLKTLSPDLLILDLGIPHRSGFLILEQLCEEGIKVGKVIVLTGQDGQRHHDYAMTLGADAFILKPYGISEVIEVSRSLIGVAPQK
jgi:CheY-like chemotaxis protein